jgi:hypothetical protein
LLANEAVLKGTEFASNATPRVYLHGPVPEGWPTKVGLPLIDVLNQLGAHGWEVCAMVSDDVHEPDMSDISAYLKRPRVLPPPPV